MKKTQKKQAVERWWRERQFAGGLAIIGVGSATVFAGIELYDLPSWCAPILIVGGVLVACLGASFARQA